jgi:hypothetical protein
MHLRHLLRRGGTKLPICPYIRYPETASFFDAPCAHHHSSQTETVWTVVVALTGHSSTRPVSRAMRLPASTAHSVPVFVSTFRASPPGSLIYSGNQHAAQPAAGGSRVSCVRTEPAPAPDLPNGNMDGWILSFFCGGTLDGSYHTRCHLGILYLVSTVKQSGVEI